MNAVVQTKEDFSAHLQGILKPVDLRKFRIPHASTPDYYVTYMEHFGADFFLNTIAAGQLPAEIAIDMNVPALVLMNWLMENTAPEQRERAREMCAESLVVKSKSVLLIEADDSAAVQLAKEYSKRLAWAAERLNSDAWGPPRPSIVEAPPSFAITINQAANDDVTSERELLRTKIINGGLQPLHVLKLNEK